MPALQLLEQLPLDGIYVTNDVLDQGVFVSFNIESQAYVSWKLAKYSKVFWHCMPISTIRFFARKFSINFYFRLPFLLLSRVATFCR